MQPEEEVRFERAASRGGWARAWRRLPAARWLPAYSRGAAVADAVAGLTLGLTLVPQSIAYAALANLPVQYGLYSSFVGTMLYVVLGTVKEVSIGPTSLMALLTLHTCRDLPVDFVVLLTFLSGCLVLLMGLLRLDFLVELMSPSVTRGFTAATAVIIVVAQLKGLLGLSFVAESPLDNLRLIARHWGEVRPADCALGAASCAALLSLRKVKDLPLRPERRLLRRALWLLSIARNALVVLAASAVAAATHRPERALFRLSGKVEAGLPGLELPPFSATLGNRTVGFVEMVERLGPGLAVLPFVMVLANIAIAKAFSAGGRVDASQEMLTLGVCNVVGSLVHAMPTCGAFTRSAVSHASGVRSPAAGLYSGVVTLLALNFLTQYFFYIPKACLSAVLICAVVFMVEPAELVRLWRARRREAAVALLTMVAGVALSVEAAVLGGAAVALAVLLRDLLRPPLLLLHVDKVSGETALLVRVRRALVYANAERACAQVRAALASSAAPPHRALLVDCGTLVLLDYTAEQVLGRLIDELERQGRRAVFFGANAEAQRALRRVRRLDARALSARSPSAALALAGEALAPAPPHAPEALPLLGKSPPVDDSV